MTEPVQYADLAEPLNELLESADTAAGRAYWEQQELGLGKELELGQRTGVGVEFEPQRVEVAYEKAEEVEEVARRIGVGVEVLLLGAWAALLSKLSGEEEIVGRDAV